MCHLYCYHECLDAECRYAECRYSECRGAFLANPINVFGLIKANVGVNPVKNANNILKYLQILRQKSFIDLVTSY